MNANTDRYGPISGFALIAIGFAAVLFERAPRTAADFAANRVALLTQSMLFLIGAAVGLWFLGSLRVHLQRFEGDPGRLSSVATGAGVVPASSLPPVAGLAGARRGRSADPALADHRHPHRTAGAERVVELRAIPLLPDLAGTGHRDHDQDRPGSPVVQDDRASRSSEGSRCRD